MQLRFRITIWYVPVANRGFDGQVTNLEAKLNESSGTLAGSGVHCWLDPHPRVTAVAKKAQPPRRLPSPQGARDLRKRRLPYPATRGRGILQKALKYSHAAQFSLHG